MKHVMQHLQYLLILFILAAKIVRSDIAQEMRTNAYKYYVLIVFSYTHTHTHTDRTIRL